MLSISRTVCAALAFAALPTLAPADDGVVRVRSSYPMQETIERIKQDIASKGIMFFSEIDQAGLAAMTGIQLRPSTLLIFGNPALGTLFITAKAEAGLDWPVRLLVTQDETGEVWAVYTDFKWTATRVITSITSAVAGQ